MKFKLIATVAATGLLAACGGETQVAQDDTTVATDTLGTDFETGTAQMPAWDTNTDDMFQRDEFTAARTTWFNEWDTNDDGRLSQEEFTTGWTEAGFSNAQGAFDEFDENNDSFLTEDEFLTDDQWDEWDANDDGVLTPDEFEYY